MSGHLDDIEAKAGLLAQRLVSCLAEKHCTVALAESCTAGLVSDLLARVSGASAVLWGSFVCYTQGAKQQMLGIDESFFAQHKLVSAPTAREMALHALEIAGVSIAAAITGIAGPLGDGSDTPIGTVYIATAWLAANHGNCREKELHFRGNRAEIRMKAAIAVIEELFEIAALNTNIGRSA
jgi:nicotinamide-nucleotide amidase